MTKPIILLVDDDPGLLSSLKSQIKTMFGKDYEYETADGGFEGLDLIDELKQEGEEVRAIICDWQMPDMKGDAFLDQVQTRHPGIGKILLTGMGDHPDLDKTFKDAGLTGVLNKPWTEAELRATLEEALG
jgi:CheY-like chemotaxis protein